MGIHVTLHALLVVSLKKHSLLHRLYKDTNQRPKEIEFNKRSINQTCHHAKELKDD
jgi:hypothetical protein